MRLNQVPFQEKAFRGLIWLTVLATISWALRAATGAGIVDDTYIFLRYAQNVAAGFGPVFNAGERVEGYTSPLWLGILTLLAAFRCDLVSGSIFLSAAIGVATVLLCVGYCRALGTSTIWLVVPTWFLLTSPIFIYWTWSGMDTALFMFLLLGGFLCFREEAKTNWALVLSGIFILLAALTRLEILVTLPVYIATLVLRYRHQYPLLLKKLTLFLAPVSLLTLHFIWRYHYYGEWLPNTYFAKAHIPWSVTVRSGLGYSARFVLSHVPYLGAFAVMWLVRAWHGVRLNSDQILVTGLVFSWIGYVTIAGGDHFAMFRFYAPVLPFFAFLMPLELERLSASLKLNRRRIVATIGLVIMLISVVNFSVFQFVGGARARQEVEMAGLWADVGRWLKAYRPPDTIIASVVVGAIPYYSNLRTIDLLGLTDREIARNGKIHEAGRIGHQRYHTEYIIQRRPDIVLLLSSGLYNEPVFSGPESINREYAYALYHLVSDDVFRHLYQYKAVQMENGRYVEFFELKR